MAVVVPIRRGRAKLMTVFVERNGAEDRSTANLHGRWMSQEDVRIHLTRFERGEKRQQI